MLSTLVLLLGCFVHIGISWDATNLAIREFRSPIEPSEAWIIYAEKGLRYYVEWQEENGPDRPISSQLEDEFKNDWVGTKSLESQQTLPKKLGYQQPGANFTLVTSEWPKENPQTIFKVWTCAKQGIFVADLVMRHDDFLDTGSHRDMSKHDEADDEGSGSEDSHGTDASGGSTNGDDESIEPAPYHFSQIAWWQWTQTFKKRWEAEHGTSHPAPEALNYSNLNSFWVTSITSIPADQLWKKVFERYTQDPGGSHELDEEKNGIDYLKFEPDDESTQNGFWALLGCPVGTGLIHMLKENKVALESRGITVIYAHRMDLGGGESESKLWADLEPCT